MATTPEPQSHHPAPPPAPPAPPAPPRSGSHILLIVLLVLALIVTVSVVAVWMGVQFISHNVSVNVQKGADGKKEVTINTPAGNFEVRNGEQLGEAELGLPFYPGATRVQDEHDKGGVALSFDLPNQHGMRLAVAKFRTPDPLDKVRDYYHQQLGSEVTKFTERDREGKTVFEIKRRDEEKIVALKSVSGETEIDLVRVQHGPTEPN